MSDKWIEAKKIKLTGEIRKVRDGDTFLWNAEEIPIVGNGEEPERKVHIGTWDEMSVDSSGVHAVVTVEAEPKPEFKVGQFVCGTLEGPGRFNFGVLVGHDGTNDSHYAFLVATRLGLFWVDDTKNIEHVTLNSVDPECEFVAEPFSEVNNYE